MRTRVHVSNGIARIEGPGRDARLRCRRRSAQDPGATWSQDLADPTLARLNRSLPKMATSSPTTRLRRDDAARHRRIFRLGASSRRRLPRADTADLAKIMLSPRRARRGVERRRPERLRARAGPRARLYVDSLHAGPGSSTATIAPALLVEPAPPPFDRGRQGPIWSSSRRSRYADLRPCARRSGDVGGALMNAD